MKPLEEVQFPVVFDRRESKLRRGSPEQPAYRAGDVIKRKEVKRAFGDYIVIGFDKNDNARLVRPFALALGPSVANPATSVSFETLDGVSVATLDEYYEVVGTGMYLERKKDDCPTNQ